MADRNQALEGQEIGVLPRELLPFEFAPRNFFERLERKDLVEDGRPLEVDLGCGDGSFLVDMAGEYPEREYLGVERLLGRVRKVGRKIRVRGLSNCRVLRLEIEYTLRWLLPAGSVARLHLLCPDPWPKLRHHKNRSFRPEMLEAVAQALEPGGEFLFMTDHEEYFEWAEMILRENAAQFDGVFERLPWTGDEFFYPKTDFQRQWEAQGKSMYRVRLKLRE